MWTVITRPNCLWCDKAKDLITSQGGQITQFDVTKQESSWLLTLLLGYTNLTTLPQIFDPQGRYVGGYKELEEYYGDKGGTAKT